MICKLILLYLLSSPFLTSSLPLIALEPAPALIYSSTSNLNAKEITYFTSILTTSGPTELSTEVPSPNPIISLMMTPTGKPLDRKTLKPTATPSDETHEPTKIPTVKTEKKPTRSPTGSPTMIITKNPTTQPFFNPATEHPTAHPSSFSTSAKNPTPLPSFKPVMELHTVHPTSSPTSAQSPTPQPSLKAQNPTPQPSLKPVTGYPTVHPISFPTSRPSSKPSIPPSRTLQHGRISNITMVFDDCLPLNSNSIQIWENVTADYVLSTMMRNNIASMNHLLDVNVFIHFLDQSVSDKRWDMAAHKVIVRQRVLQPFQQSPLWIRFDADVFFRSPRYDNNVSDYFRSTLDSEYDRVEYIVRLQNSGVDTFNAINNVVVEMMGIEILEKNTKYSDPVGIVASKRLIILISVCGALVIALFVVTFICLVRRQGVEGRKVDKRISSANNSDKICMNIDNKSTGHSSYGDAIEWSVDSSQYAVKQQAEKALMEEKVADIPDDMSFGNTTYSYHPSVESQGPGCKDDVSHETSSNVEGTNEINVISWEEGTFDEGTIDEEFDGLGNRVEVTVPQGRLGALIDSSSGLPIVESISPSSVLAGKVNVGDTLLSVDGISTYGLTAGEVLHLVGSRAHCPWRLLIFAQTHRVENKVENLDI